MTYMSVNVPKSLVYMSNNVQQEYVFKTLHMCYFLAGPNGTKVTLWYNKDDKTRVLSELLEEMDPQVWNKFVLKINEEEEVSEVSWFITVS